MDKLNAKYFLNEAGKRLQGKNARSMALFHTGVTVGFALTVTVLQYVLELCIGNTTGLSGMGTRSIMQTIQTVLQWANVILAPFWNLGFLYAAMLWARDQYARRKDLLTGFYRIGPSIGLMVNRYVIVLCVVLLCANVCSTVYLLTPAGQEMQELMLSLGTMEAYYSYMSTLSQQELLALASTTTPVLILCGLTSMALLIPLMYRFRLAEYAILNQKGVRALPAMIISATLLRRRCWQLFKLDLRLWWYYGLKTLCMVLYYLDVLLPIVGITLPVQGDGVFFGAYILYLAALLAVETAFRPRVETAYAGVYEAFAAMGPAQKKVVPAKPQNVPWDEE